MKKFPKLNFSPCFLRVCKDPRGEGVRVWDKIRDIWLVLTPEEWVRRHLIEYLISEVGVPLRHISQEYPVEVAGMSQRADLVVTGSDGRPVLLAECKAPGIAIDNTVYAQAVRYNNRVGAKYVFLTNGMTHCVLRCDGEGLYFPCSELPDLCRYFR
ncbi:MAG: type I restriction enzyme HsdR N-terminal domain-containing protein [Alistipes sp.]|nr:type I restriction enzyme HsdR N-terminal domain-containing protein [Alistipes sp.]